MPSSQQEARSVYFEPKSLSDALDSTDEFPGAMASLQNLIFDPSSTGILQCRPACVVLLQSKFPTPLPFTYVSVWKIVGDVLYGLASSALHAGYDQPFAFNLLTNSLITPTGVTAANVPTSPATSGAWTPPTADVIGTKVIVTHPGFKGQPFATATGSITFPANPTNGATITLGGSVVTFVTATPVVGDNQVQILSTLALTLASLPATLANFGDPNVSQGVYTVAGSTLNIAYVAPGQTGNNFTLAASAATVSGPTLTGGVGNYFGYFDITNPLAPVWGAGNMTINPLSTVPDAVAQFNNRAYFIVNPTNGQPALIVSDPLLPLQSTNGTYILTFGDNQPLTALAGLPLQNQLGGVIQSIIVFKGANNLYQVTGDPLPNTAAGAWTKNTLNAATGTLAPRSIVATSTGLMFMSPQGYRVLDFLARVSPPIGADGSGVSVPFIQCPVPSRVAAAANASLLRVSLTNAAGIQQEFWFDIGKGVWTGPHTLPANIIAPYKNTFIMSPIGVPNSLVQSDWLQGPSPTFVEFNQPMTWAFQTSMLPDTKDMEQYEMHETLVKISTATGATVIAADETGATIADSNGAGQAAATIAATGASSNWSNANWSGSMFYGQPFSMSPVQINWPCPVVFGRMSLQMTGTSDSLTRIGALSMRYEQLGYLAQPGN